MFVECDNQVVVRYYDEEADLYKKVWLVKKAEVLGKHLLIADDRYYYDYEGDLIFLGTKATAQEVLAIPRARLIMFDTTGLPLPFKAVFIQDDSVYCFAIDYEIGEDIVILTLLHGKQVVYSITEGKPDLPGQTDCFLNREFK